MAKKHHAYFEEGNFYHVYNRANTNKEKLFFEHKNYHYFLKQFDFYLSDYLEVWAYCLIPNHFHFLVKIKELSGDANIIVTEQFRKFFISYTQAINKQEFRRGSLFQKSFKRKLIDSEEYISALVHYIHFNPIYHKLVDNIDQWEHSSYLSLLSDRPTKLYRNEVIGWFGGKKEFERVHLEDKRHQKISGQTFE